MNFSVTSGSHSACFSLVGIPCWRELEVKRVSLQEVTVGSPSPRGLANKYREWFRETPTHVYNHGRAKRLRTQAWQARQCFTCKIFLLIGNRLSLLGNELAWAVLVCPRPRHRPVRHLLCRSRASLRIDCLDCTMVFRFGIFIGLGSVVATIIYFTPIPGEP